MILQPTIDAALFEIAEDSGRHELRSAIWEDYLRPVFLKNDPAEGARIFAEVKQSPNEHIDLIKTTLRDHLRDKPEALHKLQHLLEISE
ncbi:hypothetical protein FUA23_01655 [Neolewinella aurantiaca]|uniref:Uncharacterized protein n=1 Tax=Neolewinella aurantiaca TaxID=2602767 RepID=A0A5C7FXD3_9BACT|nr:hypothetical protein [Neolewinella aurantiaca]TXF91428.1 hypothetical protein FUA23_01655 [Neolewinella aurantiaca]